MHILYFKLILTLSPRFAGYFYRKDTLTMHSNKVKQKIIREVCDVTGINVAKKEMFILLFFDESIKNKELMLLATGDEKSVNIIKHKLNNLIQKKKRKNIIAIHNHPSGNLDLSLEDVFLYSKLDDLVERYNVQMIDFFVVSEERAHSAFEEKVLFF